MQPLRNLILQHLRYNVCGGAPGGGGRPLLLYGFSRHMCASPNQDNSSENIKACVIDLVKKFDKIDANKVTKTADFQKDLSLDSLDRVELGMAFEQEFSIEIPNDKADKLSCCADVARYIKSDAQSSNNNAESS